MSKSSIMGFSGFALLLLIAVAAPGICPIGDLTGDCRVDFEDMLLLGQQWLAAPERPADLNGDDAVDMNDLGLFGGNWRKTGIPLFLNEVTASNSKTKADPQGQYDDWIEIYNAGNQPIDIGGMYLTDDPDVPTKWRVPTGNAALTTINSKGYLLIWADNDTADSGLHANFRIDAAGDEIAVFDKDGSTLIDSISFRDQTADISYGRYPDGAGSWSLMAFPSPGSANMLIYDGFAAKPSFSHERGFYTWPFAVTLSSETEGATIYYSVDGSTPFDFKLGVPKGMVYAGPIQITKTTCLRAVAWQSRWKASAAETHTYVFVADVINQSPNGERPGANWPAGSVNGQVIDYGMDPDVVKDAKYKDLMDDALLAVPTISLVTDIANLFDSSTGIYVNARNQGRAWERPVSMELLDPNGGGGFQIDAGVRIRGGYSRSSSNPKHAFRLLFRPDYGQSRLRFALFGDEGVDEFEGVDLRCSQNYSWSFEGGSSNSHDTFVREVFSRDTQHDMGQPYTRSRYYHLYMDGHYWGLYQTQERSEASYAESYFGGDKEDYDVIKSRAGNGGYDIEATDGTLDAWRRLWDSLRTTVSDQTYYRLQGLNTDGTSNPTYERLLDIDNLIDYMLCTYYVGDPDGPVSAWARVANNFYAIYNRKAPDGFKLFRHDAEHSLYDLQESRLFASTTLAVGNQFNQSNPLWMHTHLIVHPEYKMRFADRVYKYFFNDGVLTPGRCTSRFMNRANQIDLAIIAESARWGDAKRSTPRTKDADWLPDMNRMVSNYFPYRTGVVLSQFKSQGWYPTVDAPTFNQNGGPVPAGFGLTIIAPTGTAWYTLNGTDPRLKGGAINTSAATAYSGPVTLTKSTHVKSRVLSGTTWSALHEATFAVGPVAENLRITEIMYHPQDTGNPNDPNTEYVELKNIGSQTINLNLVKFTNGIDFTFGDTDLAPNKYILVVKDRNAFTAKYGQGLPVAGAYTGSLDNAGEKIELQDAALSAGRMAEGKLIHSFKYADNWYEIADGMGFSITVKDPANIPAEPNSLSDKSLWRPSAGIGGSPGIDDTGSIPELGDIVINEIMAHSHVAGADWIELHNTTNNTINIGGWFLSDDQDNLTKYQISQGTVIGPYGYKVFYEHETFNNLADPGCKVPFALSENGETLYLQSGFNGVLTGYSEQEKFDASETGVSMGRYLKSTGAYNFVELQTPTPNSANSYPLVGPVVINEIMYHPDVIDDAEYVELLNISNSAVRFYDDVVGEPWRFTDDPDNPGIDFRFPKDSPVTLNAGEYLLLVKDLTLFSSKYTVPQGVKVYSWGAGKLDNAGEKIQLSKPGDMDAQGTRYWIRVDRVVYSDGSHPGGEAGATDPWPIDADGLGKSLSRKYPDRYGNDPNNWQASAPSTGKTNP